MNRDENLRRERNFTDCCLVALAMLFFLMSKTNVLYLFNTVILLEISILVVSRCNKKISLALTLILSFLICIGVTTFIYLNPNLLNII